MPGRYASRRTLGLLAGIAAALALPAGAALAHEGNVGFSEIWVRDSTVEYVLYLEAEHLATQVPVAAEGDLAIWEGPDGHDLKVSRGDMAAMVRDGVSVTSRGQAVEPVLTDLAMTDVEELTHLGGVALMDPVALLELRFAYEFPEPVDDYAIDYDLFFPEEDQEPHSNLAWIHDGGRTATYIFSPDAAQLTPERAQPVEAPPGGGDGGATAWPLAATAVAGALAVSGGVVALLRPRSPRPARR